MKCGIEIHQRIAGRKLFCGCDPGKEGSRQQNFSRKLHAVLSELGELDSAVRVEALRERSFNYSAPISSTCLVEADEEPPHRISQGALHAALVFCGLFSSKPVDELHIMRKNVIDGSNTAGFQRTALVGIGGSVSTPSGKIGIQTLCIEEESAGIIEGKESSASYDLSRLGIPLVEIATAPELYSGQQAQEAALAIGTLLRKTGLVQRGIGTIRQDLNISIPGGARVEIKGVQDLSMIAKTVELEGQRQQALLEISKEASARLKGKGIEPKFYDLTEIFASTRSQMVGKAIKDGAKAVGLALPGFAGLLGRELYPNRRFGTELADYARSAGVKGLIHSDESMDKYGFSEDEISEVRVAMSLKAQDAVVIVLGEENRAFAALSEVACRASFVGVPEETRKANPDGTSSYMRPLPGKARLYPETDLPIILITKEMLRQAKETVREIAAKQEGKEKLLSSLNEELAAQLSEAKGLLSHNPRFKLSEGTPELSIFALAVKEGVDPKFAASALTNTLQSLKREGESTQNIDEPRMVSLLRLYGKGLFTKPAAAEILREMCKDAGASPEQAMKKIGAERISGQALEKLIKEKKLDFKGLMAKYRLQIDAQEAQETLKKNK